jgi:hypothetical protein
MRFWSRSRRVASGYFSDSRPQCVKALANSRDHIGDRLSEGDDNSLHERAFQLKEWFWLRRVSIQGPSTYKGSYGVRKTRRIENGQYDNLDILDLLFQPCPKLFANCRILSVFSGGANPCQRDEVLPMKKNTLINTEAV